VIGLSAHGSSHALEHAGARAVVVAGLALLAGGAVLLALAPDRADYLTDLLPGFLALGAGVGLIFPAVSITAMADVGHEDAGMASGLLQTSHEIGAAFGVAVISAVATAQATAAAGYESGFIAAAVIAGVLGLLALVAVPTVRPGAVARAAMH
jgi:MFS family permease